MYKRQGLLMKLLQKNKIKNSLNTELTEMGVFSAVAGNQLPNQLQKRVLLALFHLRCPSQSHQRSARGRTRLTTVTFISCRSFERQLLYFNGRLVQTIFCTRKKAQFVSFELTKSASVCTTSKHRPRRDTNYLAYVLPSLL